MMVSCWWIVETFGRIIIVELLDSCFQMGKYRPKNLDLVRINTDSAVNGITRKAYKKLLATKSPTMAVQMLLNLKGIGASAASAILSAAYPDQVPFMSDEGMASTPGVEAGDSTIAEFTNYSEALLQKTEYLKTKGLHFFSTFFLGILKFFVSNFMIFDKFQIQNSPGPPTKSIKYCGFIIWPRNTSQNCLNQCRQTVQVHRVPTMKPMCWSVQMKLALAVPKHITLMIMLMIVHQQQTIQILPLTCQAMDLIFLMVWMWILKIHDLFRSVKTPALHPIQ